LYCGAESGIAQCEEPPGPSPRPAQPPSSPRPPATSSWSSGCCVATGAFVASVAALLPGPASAQYRAPPPGCWPLGTAEPTGGVCGDPGGDYGQIHTFCNTHEDI
jgi:hypothetical protein